MFKSLQTNLTNCYVVNLVDESQLVAESKRSRFFKGDVPHVKIVAQKVNNKKVTYVTGLELFMIDLPEFCSYA